MGSASPENLELELWRHSDPKSTFMWEFKELISRKYDVELDSYEHLYNWSINNISPFWDETWRFTGIKSSLPYSKVLEKGAPMFPRPPFFQGALLNFAENLLYPEKCTVDPESIAIISATEQTQESITWATLRERVRQCAAAMKSLGVKQDDRVAGFLGNHANTVVAMLAATSMGALWTGVSPDTGVHAVLDRLVQIEPVLLFADNGVLYNGKTHDSHSKLSEISRELKELKAVVVFETVPGHVTKIDDLVVAKGKAMTYESFLNSAINLSAPLIFTQLSPDHPIYILYSSGTTGKPKCIVHGSIGTLIQHKKEHMIHCDIHPGDKLFYFTTCTWMMWHWLVSGLASGATIVCYDGSPFKPHGELSMAKLIQDLKITHFGTSAKYLSILEQKNIFPMRETESQKPLDLSSLKAIYSTGSPLAPSTFRYIYQAFPPTINLGSITGGTDIVSLFGAPSPLCPVYVGEIQCLGLGMAIQAWDHTGKQIPTSGPESNEPGDLVCTEPFPCQPVAFYSPPLGVHDPAGHEKYRSSYFATFGPEVWHHGDFIRINPITGGLIMLGRSDGILKPSGVRFGSAEIYNVLLKHFADEIEDALCIGRRRETDDDETVVLFCKMMEGKKFDEGLRERIRAVVRKELSSRHVPGIIEECFEIPVTTNGKKIEVAVKQILCGMNVKTSASVANAECLDWYREWTHTH